MNSEVSANSYVAPSPAADDWNKIRERRSKAVKRRNPSPAYCIGFLVICTAIVELGDGLLIHAMRPYLSHGGLILLDILFMISIIVPSFYFFVYRPMKLYELERKAAEADIRFLTRRLIQTTDRERRTLARDVYDQFGQSLSVLQFSMGSLKESLVDAHVDQLSQCDQISESISRLANMVRKVSCRLCPPQLDDLGLIPTLEWAISDIGESDGSYRIDFSSQLLDGLLPTDIEHALYAIFCEAMSNISQHAAAKQVQIYLVGTTAQVCLEVCDDGVGFCLPENEAFSCSRGVGLLSIRERAETLGGTLDFETLPGKGTRLQVCLPRSLRRRDDLRKNAGSGPE